MNQTDSKPARSATSVRSRKRSQLIRSCGRYTPNHGTGTSAEGSVCQMQLDGATAIVTGGASGIGQATAAALQHAGARVAVLDLEDAPHADLAVRCDVGDEGQLVGAVGEVVAQYGGLDVAVINAGIGGMAKLLDLTSEEWDRVMRVNLRGAFLTLRECARAMVTSGAGGAIVAIGSVSGMLVDRRMSHYSVSKAGVAQLVRVAARELGEHGIR